MQIDFAYLDLDSVAYIGACIAQKTRYTWMNKVTLEKSETFKSAKEAKVWLEGSKFFNTIENEDDWERVTSQESLPEEDALKVTIFEMENWIETAKTLTGNPDIILKGFLTASGTKTKDVPGLEKRYQQNRYICTEEWLHAPKPRHLTACREHILKVYDWIKLAPAGFEADALVITQAEKRGKSAVIVSKDKDLKQAMGTYIIDMNPDKRFRKIEYLDPFGKITLEKKKDHTCLVGSGFKFLCAQAVMGDASDGYSGVSNFGAVSTYNLLDPCTTYVECLDTLIKFYNERFPDGHIYISWDKQEVSVTANQLLSQHFQLAYQERGLNDTSNPVQRYLEGLPIFYDNKYNNY